MFNGILKFTSVFRERWAYFFIGKLLFLKGIVGKDNVFYEEVNSEK